MSDIFKKIVVIILSPLIGVAVIWTGIVLPIIVIAIAGYYIIKPVSR